MIYSWQDRWTCSREGGREEGGQAARDGREERGEAAASTCRVGTSEGPARQVVVVLLCTGNERCVNCRENV